MREFEMRRGRLLMTTALLSLFAASGPALAQEVSPTTDQAATPAPAPKDDGLSDERLTAMSYGKLLRPFGEPIRPFGAATPAATRLRTFAGDVSGTAGRLRTFSGDVAADAGRLRTFAGEIGAFATRLRTFWADPATGTSTDFWGTLYPASGALTASAGRIRTFSGDFETMATRIRTFEDGMRAPNGALLGYADALANYAGLTGAISDLVAVTKKQWGNVVKDQTGQTFEKAFSDRMLAKWDIDLKDPVSLSGMDEVNLELFLLDWHDNLMMYSGVDQVDHWMKAVRWNPALTQVMGSGADSRIGILDFTITGAETANIVKASGISTVAGGHGSAVASLLVSAHDGKGTMGFAPRASVVSYNPFDATMTAGWSDIKKGVTYLTQNGANIINASLGVPGWTFSPEWNDIFVDPFVALTAKNKIFVMAAGNDGSSQTTNVQWAKFQNPEVILVGSVDPTGVISSFSNRPGTACMTEWGYCRPGMKLMDRFVVAPGEFILMSDGQGGVTRMSGTSFAAPMVAGTIALIQDRWPWLVNFPGDTADIVLKTARDLGAPGTDPVYGRGMLDVEAALSPINMNALQWKQSYNGKLYDTSAGIVRATSAKTRATWEANSVYFYVFESTGSSYRDFAIPMSTKLAGKTVGNSNEQFNTYLQSRFWSWFNGPAASSGGGDDDFTARRFSADMPGFGDLRASVTMTPRTWRAGLRQSTMPYDTGVAFRTPGGRVGFSFGSGYGGADLSGQRGFGLQSDYDLDTGGANPFLGLATGGSYASAEVALTDRVRVSTGISRQNARLDFDRMSPDERVSMSRVDPYRATANTLTVHYDATDWLTATAGYTMLKENSALLGVQSLDRSDFADGTTTDAATFGADVSPARGLTLSATGTLGRSRAGDAARQNLAVSDGGVLSSAYQVTLTKIGLLDGHDRARLSFAQPLHMEHGSIDVTTVKVVDRQTGALGAETQTVDLQGQQRRYVAEALYGRTLMDGRAQMNLFGRADLRDDAANRSSLTMGGSFSLGF